MLFFYDGWQCVQEYTSAGVRTKRYVYGEGIDEVVKATVPDVNDVDSDSNTTEDLDLYYHQNSLGSVAAVTDLNGAVVEEYSYTAYGELTVDTNVCLTSIRSPQRRQLDFPTWGQLSLALTLMSQAP